MLKYAHMAVLALSLPCLAEPVDYREAMRSFVQVISADAKGRTPGFVVIPQNGLELLTRDGEPDGPAAAAYVASIDGVGREDVFYGYTADNVATPAADRAYLVSFCERARDSGLRVLVTDYCHSHGFMDDSYQANAQRGFLSFAADRRELDAIPDYPAAPYAVNATPVASLAQAANMLYLLNAGSFSSKAAYLNALRATDYDLFIIDSYYEGEPLTPAEVASLKQKAHGGSRIVIAYMSIGEAESYRPYWQDAWNNNAPDWIVEENPYWPGNFVVQYWQKPWQDLIVGLPDSYLTRIVNAGFDGVYLDIIDAFEYFESASEGEGEGEEPGGCLGGTLARRPPRPDLTASIVIGMTITGLLAGTVRKRRKNRA